MNLVGQRIGSYVVQKELGAGGTGTVYLCQHTLIERAVAIKVLHEEHAQDPDQVARFFQEAKAAAEIGHPNIISIIDFGHLEHVDGKPPYLMMECLDGVSLDKRLRTGGLSLEDIRHIMSQVCSALVASHGKGIIHRDLKPSNVFLCDRTFDHLFVKVLDFGTAKLTAPGIDGHKTMIGMVLGTPAYMSPEQCEGKGAIDHRSDIYSLGVMLYEMLTGTLPFDGEVGEMMIHQLFHAPPPLRERNPAVPPAWEALCLRMMEKGRENRFQSVTELAHALEDLEGHAAAYQAFRTNRSETGKSGHTMIAPADGFGSSDGVVAAPMATSDSRATVHGSLEDFAPRAGVPPPAAPPHPSGDYPPAAAPPHPSGDYPPAAAPPHPSGDYPAAAAPPYPPASGAYAPVPSGPVPSAAYAAVAAPPPYPPSGAYPSAAGPSGPYPTPAGPYPAPAARYPTPSGPYPPPPDPVGPCTALVTEPRYVGFARTLMVRPGGRWYDAFEVCRTGGVAAPPTLPPDLSLFVTWVEHPYLDPSLAAVVFLSLRTGWSTVVLCARARW